MGTSCNRWSGRRLWPSAEAASATIPRSACLRTRSECLGECLHFRSRRHSQPGSGFELQAFEKQPNLRWHTFEGVCELCTRSDLGITCEPGLSIIDQESPTSWGRSNFLWPG